MYAWNISPGFVLLLGLSSAAYLRGRDYGSGRAAAFLGGLAALFAALDSPLDSWAQLSLPAHMVQHLLLLIVAPALIVYSDPLVPILRGLPRGFVKEGLGPFLAWPALRRMGRLLSGMPVAWSLFALSTVGWHVPRVYELALESPFWHGLQHGSFFWTGVLFWWPVLRRPSWAAVPYLLLADLLNTALSAFFVFSDRVLYPTYGGLAGQVTAGAIMWVPGSIFYLVPAAVIAARQFGSATVQKPVRHRSIADFNLKRWRVGSMRRAAQAVMLLLALAVVLDGFRGSGTSATNLAGVWPWVYWRAFAVLALILCGNLFCMVCPFTLVRDWVRLLVPEGRPWPVRFRTKWIAVALTCVYLYSAEAFRLWDKPRVTALLIIGYFGAAAVIDSVFRGSGFCKYVCPIGQFHFVSSLVSPGEIAVRSQVTCKACRTYDCIRGNESARGCELNLFLPVKSGNMDCTFCMDCVQACPQENVTIAFAVRAPDTRWTRRKDVAVLAGLMVCGAFVSAAAMIAPVMMWEHRIAGGMRAGMALLVMAGVVAPALWIGCSRWRHWLAALVPLGLAMWGAHLMIHLSAELGFGLSRGLQLLLLDAGLVYSWYFLWRGRSTGTWAAMALGLYGVGVWICFQPMASMGGL